MQSIPRNEYPRPQMVRDSWLNLNGEWDFEIDNGRSGRDRNLISATSLSQKIVVPFCPESELSGIGNKDFMDAVWYKKEIDVPAEWLDGKVLIHFGAVDYQTELWVNGASAGTHVGGYISFTFDITKMVKVGKNILTVCATDDGRSGKQPAGKQSDKYKSYGCAYTRTTGIWQTVWLENVPNVYVSKLFMTPDINNSKLDIEARYEGYINDGSEYGIEATAFYKGKEIGNTKAVASWRSSRLSVKLSELYLWETLKPELYDLSITLSKDGKIVDKIGSYFGMRSVALTDNAILINGKPVFQRLILDQGFYPDGIYTASTDDELKKDIQRSIDMGFNGARLHQKIFEPRFLFWADKMGYLCWGEHANWFLDITVAEGLMAFMPEWIEALERDYNHPAIIGWCPFNETTGAQDNRVIDYIFKMTKAIDSTRPVIDTSGWFHVDTDVFDVHDYDQDPKVFGAKYDAFKEGGKPYVSLSKHETWKEGTPYFVSEFGGIWWAPEKDGWGYGDRPKTAEEFIARYRGLVTYLLEHPKICAFCYTQLTDVEQEVNGLYTYERVAKFDPAILYKINTQIAAIEK